MSEQNKPATCPVCHLPLLDLHQCPAAKPEFPPDFISPDRVIVTNYGGPVFSAEILAKMKGGLEILQHAREAEEKAARERVIVAGLPPCPMDIDGEALCQRCRHHGGCNAYRVKLLAGLKEITAFSEEGFAGILPGGTIVDRRRFPDAMPVGENLFLGVGKPRELHAILEDMRNERPWEKIKSFADDMRDAADAAEGTAIMGKIMHDVINQVAPVCKPVPSLEPRRCLRCQGTMAGEFCYSCEFGPAREVAEAVLTTTLPVAKVVASKPGCANCGMVWVSKAGDVCADCQAKPVAALVCKQCRKECNALDATGWCFECLPF